MENDAAGRFAASRALHERARRVLAGGVSSQFRALGVFHPMAYARGEGARLWDVDGNELIDHTLAQGPCILGHSHPEVVARVREAIGDGQLYAGQHLEEIELAETLQGLIPSAERVRFASSGSEAAQACLRLARHVTGRTRWIKFEGHYHGWLDGAAWGVNPPFDGANDVAAEIPPLAWCGGIPPAMAGDLIVLPWNDLDRVAEVMARRGHEVAAVMTEPVMCNQGCITPRPGFLEGLRALCDRHGAALIFDEIITGFRLSLGGAQGAFGVTPDLSLFGKALGSGFPIAAICGGARWMAPLERGEVYHAGTMNGNVACVAAASATLEVLARGDGAALRHVARLGAALRDGLMEVGREAGLDVLAQGPGPMFHMGFTGLPRIESYRQLGACDRAAYAEFCAAMLLEGVRLIERGLWYVSAAHTEEDVALVLTAARRAMRAMAR